MKKTNKKQIKVLKGLIKDLYKQYDKLNNLKDVIGKKQSELCDLADDIEQEAMALEYEE